jgi:hypothetical protein
MVLEAVDAVVAAVGGEAARDTDVNGAIASTVPHLVDVARGATGAMRAAALAPLGRVAKAAPSSIVPNVPRALPVVLDALEAAAAIAVDREGETLELTAALTALATFVCSVPRLLSPYVPRIIGILLQQAGTPASNPTAQRALEATLTELPLRLEPRILVPALAAHLPEAERAGTPALVALLSLLRDVLTAMPPPAVAAHAGELATLVMSALNVRSSRPPAVAVAPAEAAAVDTLVALVLKLSEVHFKPLFTRLAEWGSSVPAHAATSTEPSERSKALVARQTTFLRCVSALSAALRSLFTPYFVRVVDLLVLSLEAGGVDDSDDARPAKRRRRRQEHAVLGPSTDGAGGLRPEAARRRVAVACVHQACLYDIEGRFVNGQRFERLLGALLAALQAGSGQEGEWDVLGDSERALPGRLEVGTRTELPEASIAVAATLVQLAIAASGDALWKMLNQRVRLFSAF